MPKSTFIHMSIYFTVQMCSRSILHVRMKSDSITHLNQKSIVFLGTPRVASNVLQMLHSASLTSSLFKIDAVVTQPPATTTNRSKKLLTKSPVHELAEKLSLPTYYPEKSNSTEFLEKLESMKPDLCITAAYGNYLPKRFLAIPQFGTINIHPSVLPKYRGAAPVQRCLEAGTLNAMLKPTVQLIQAIHNLTKICVPFNHLLFLGDSESGVTILETVSKMDAGPILYQYSNKLSGQEKSTELLEKYFEIGTKELLNLLPSVFDGTALRIPQDEYQASYAPKLESNESRVDFSVDSAKKVHNKVRGFADWPGVWSSFRMIDSSSQVMEDNIRLKLITTVVLREPMEHSIALNLHPTNIANFEKNPQFGLILKITCQDGSQLGIIELQPAGKKVMAARDYMNGLRGRQLQWIIPPAESPVLTPE